MLGRLATLVALALVASGCLQAASVEENSLPAPSLLSMEGSTPGTALVWTGGEIAAKDGGLLGGFYFCVLVACTDELTCEPGSCEVTRFRLEGEPATVQVRVQSVRNYTVGPFLRVLDGGGKLVSHGSMTDWLSIAVLQDAKPGEYQIEVIAAYGAGRYEAAVVVATPRPAETAADARDLLPDLATIRPADLRIETPRAGPLSILPTGGLAPGCGSDEAIEAGARRCLRFSNGIANLGEGPLEVRLAPEDATAALAGLGRFEQVIHRSDGSTREVPVGGASFHATHGHYHYTGLATYALYAYDEATGARGTEVAQGRKAGFCFYDTAMVDLTRADVGPQGYNGRGCLDPAASAAGSSWYTGVSPGFTDFYGWYLPDQYIDISGLPDGVYELVTTADGGGTLVERDTSNNSASAVFRLAGNDVVVLSTTGA